MSTMTTRARILWILALAASATLAPRALAGEPAKEVKEQKTQLKIVAGDAGTIDVEVGTMKVGEHRNVKTDQGKPVEITRTESGYQLDVAGKKIDVKLDGGDGMVMRFGGEDGDEDQEIRVVHKGKGDHHGDRNLVIVTGGDDDEDENGQHVIRKRIVVNGDDEDGEHHPGERTIRKRVIITHDGDGEPGTERRMEIKVLDDDEDLAEAMAEGADGPVVVIKKKRAGGAPGEQRIEVRVETGDGKKKDDAPKQDGDHH